MKLWIYKGNEAKLIDKNDEPFYLEQGYTHSPSNAEIQTYTTKKPKVIDYSTYTAKQLQEELDRREVSYRKKDTKATLLQLIEYSNAS